MTRSLLVISIIAAAAIASPLGAQARDRDARTQVPRDHLPPPGMCRIWLDKVPPAQQPAPTDCASAVRNLPRNARVIFNDEQRKPKLPPVKSLKPPAGDDKQPSKGVGVGPDGKPLVKPLVKPPKPAEPEGDVQPERRSDR